MWLACPDCREESAFEQPPCTEGHGLDCPEWFCVTCGSAVFVGALEEEIFRQAADAARRRAVHGARRRAAHGARHLVSSRQTSAHGVA
jgi:hypothetical protein